jgi:hypothetical protein
VAALRREPLAPGHRLGQMVLWVDQSRHLAVGQPDTPYGPGKDLRTITPLQILPVPFLLPWHGKRNGVLGAVDIVSGMKLGLLILILKSLSTVMSV